MGSQSLQKLCLLHFKTRIFYIYKLIFKPTAENVKLVICVLPRDIKKNALKLEAVAYRKF